MIPPTKRSRLAFLGPVLKMTLLALVAAGAGFALGYLIV